ncbi:MAG: hypothetical protein ACLFVJ_07355 [Persicimonas sp.]
MSLMFNNQNRYLWSSASSYGDDAVEDNVLDTDADRIWQDVRNIDITPTGEVVHVPRQRGSAAGNKHGFIKGMCEVSGEVPLQPYISASDQISYNDAILKMMNFEPDLSVSDEATYTLKTKAQADATIYKYLRNVEGDKQRLLTAIGTRANGNFTFETNAEPIIGIDSGLARYNALTDPAEFIDTDGAAALLKDGSTTVTALSTGEEKFADVDPLMCSGMTLTVGGTEHTVSATNLDLAWTVDTIEAITGDSTLRKVILTRDDSDSRPNGSFSLVDFTDAILNDIITKYQNGEELALVLTADNGTDQITMTMGQVQLGVPEAGSNGNLRQYDIPFHLNGDWSDLAGDNDISLLFDAV